MTRTLSILHMPDNAELLQTMPSADLEAGEIRQALRQSRAQH